MIVSDFDYTLAYLEYGLEWLFELFESRGVTRDVVAASYDATKKSGGFNLESLVAEVLARASCRLGPEEIKKDFDSRLASALKLYRDVPPFLDRIKMSGQRFIIVTAGNKAFQKQKINLVGLGDCETFVVPRAGEKVPVVRKLLERGSGKIVYIDDKASELDMIREAFGGGEVETILIKRQDSPYRSQIARRRHREVDNLEEVRSID